MNSYGGQWKQYKDDKGRVYLHNAATQETRWLWEHFTDQKTNRDYYNNVLTGESRWAEEFDQPQREYQGGGVGPTSHRDQGYGSHAPAVRAAWNSREQQHHDPYHQSSGSYRDGAQDGLSREGMHRDPGKTRMYPEDHGRGFPERDEPRGYPPQGAAESGMRYGAGYLSSAADRYSQEPQTDPAKITFRVAPTKTARAALGSTKRILQIRDPDEVEEVDPNGRRILFNRRTHQSRYVDEPPAYASPRQGEGSVAENGAEYHGGGMPQKRRRSPSHDMALHVQSGERGQDASRMGGRQGEQVLMRPASPGRNQGSYRSQSPPAQQVVPSPDRRRMGSPRKGSDGGQKANVMGQNNTDEAGVFKHGSDFHCEPCDRWFSDHATMKSHAKSRSHSSNVSAWKRRRNISISDLDGGSMGSRETAEESHQMDYSAWVGNILLGSYPGALKLWIHEARNRSPVEDQQKIDRLIRDTLMKDIDSGEIWTKDWSKLPHPEVQECTHYSRTRKCSFGKTCKNYHNGLDSFKEGRNPKRSRSDGRSDPMSGKLSWTGKDAAKFEQSRSNKQGDARDHFVVGAKAASGKRYVNRAYHDTSKDVLEDKSDVKPSSEGGRLLYAATRSEELAVAYRRCKPVWSQVVVFNKNDDRAAIVGRNRNLEKEFLRMNNFEADPEEVRPVEVLDRALTHILNKYRAGGAEYAWMVKQFKSMRQDLLVQNVRSEISVRLYEEHARIAIESRDIGELNQCLTQLKELYVMVPSDFKEEFLAYSMLYEVYSGVVSNKNGRNLTRMLQQLFGMRKHPVIAFALKARQAVARNEYWKLRKLKQEAAALTCGQLLIQVLKFVEDALLSRALVAMAKSCRPYLPVSIIAHRLGLEPIEEAALPFLERAKAVMARDEDGELAMNCKESVKSLVIFKPTGITAMGGT